MKKAISLVMAFVLLCAMAAFPASAADVRSSENLIEVFGFEYLDNGTNLKNVSGYGQQYRLEYHESQTDGFGLGADGRYEALIASGKGYNSSKALKWLPHSTKPHSPLTIDLSADPKGVTNWSGVTEVWLYVNASEFPETTIMFNFGMYLSKNSLNQAPADNNVPDVVINKFGAPIFVQNIDPEDSSAWKLQAATTWRRVTLPAGFAGWVKFPVNPATLGILGKNVGDNFSALDFSYVAGLFLEMNFEWMGQWDNTNGTYIEMMPKDNTKSVFIDSVSIKVDESKRKTTPPVNNTTTGKTSITTKATDSNTTAVTSGTGTDTATTTSTNVDTSTIKNVSVENSSASVDSSESITAVVPGNGPNWLVIGIVIGVLVIAAAAVAVFLFMKKKKA